MANCWLRRDWQLVEAATTSLPSDCLQFGMIREISYWWSTAEWHMHALCIVILSKSIELALQIESVLEKETVKEFTSRGSDQSLDEGV